MAPINHTNEEMKEIIMKRIESGRVTMRSRLYFGLRLGAVVSISVLVLLVSVALSTFILFSIRISGHEALLHFGSRGVFTFFHVFPWPLLVIDLLLVALLEMLLRKFRFGYRSPILYLLLGLVALSISLGFFVDRGTPVNDLLFIRSRHHALPAPFGVFYERVPIHHVLSDGICRCTITSIRGNMMYAEDRTLGTTTNFTIFVPPDNPDATTTGLGVGDTVFVIGDVEGGTLRAVGIRSFHVLQPIK
jgi:hypothetical protein